MRTELRLTPAWLRPVPGAVRARDWSLALLASLLDGVTVVILIPLLKHLFGTAGSAAPGATRLEHRSPTGCWPAPRPASRCTGGRGA